MEIQIIIILSITNQFQSFLFCLDNFISELKREDLHSLGSSLKVLDLSGNCLTSVPEAIFWDLQRLESLDLSRNNIIQIHSMAFQNGVINISFIKNIDLIIQIRLFYSIQKWPAVFQLAASKILHRKKGPTFKKLHILWLCSSETFWTSQTFKNYWNSLLATR